MLDGKSASSKKNSEDVSEGKPLDSVSSGNKESSPADLVERKVSAENGLANEVAGEALKPASVL